MFKKLVRGYGAAAGGATAAKSDQTIFKRAFPFRAWTI